MVLDKVVSCCQRVEALLRVEPSLVLCEREFQILLHTELLKEFPEQLEISFSPGTIKADGLTDVQHKVNRVFRELNLVPALGRSSPEPDLTILENREQVVLSKENGAPSSFTQPFSAVIEIKAAISWSQLVEGGTPSRLSKASAIVKDIGKYAEKELLSSSVSKHFISIVLTPHPEFYNNQSNEQFTVIPVKYPSKFVLNPKAQTPTQFDYDRCLFRAITKTHNAQKQTPLGMLREKDFETALVNHLRDCSPPYVPVIDRNDQIIGNLNPIRSQWKTINTGGRMQNRVHDIVVLKYPVRLSKWGPSQQFLPIGYELELKTSHSMSHNWFRQKSLEKELSFMSQMKRVGELEKGIFLMFRYGRKMWEVDATDMMRKLGNLTMFYLTSYLNDTTEEFEFNS